MSKTILAFVIIGCCASGASGQITNLSLVPEADAFLRAEAPLENYGRAGSLAIAGPSATNGFGLPGGRFDSLLRFPLTEAIASLDAAFGHQDWFIFRVTLRLNEVAAPANAILPRGAAGTFEVRWLAAGPWTEGTGSPSVPTSDGVNYQNLASLLDPQRDGSLGFFTNNGLDQAISFELSLLPAFGERLRSGSTITLHLRPASEGLGFVFNSRNFATESARPRLELFAAAGPPPRLLSIEPFGAQQVLLRFEARSNWVHILQGCDRWAPGSAASWTNLFVASVQPFDRQVEVREAVTKVARFYRLAVNYPATLLEKNSASSPRGYMLKSGPR